VLRVTEVPATSFAAAAIEFTVTGTAVRAGGCPPLARPFASDLLLPETLPGTQVPVITVLTWRIQLHVLYHPRSRRRAIY
jgi:hypothetical protein